MALVAIWVLPVHLGPGRTTHSWKIPAGASALAPDNEIPVFCISPNGTATRCGIARSGVSGRIAFTSYGRVAETGLFVPVLAASDMGLLWALGDPRGKLVVRDSAAALVQQVTSNISGLTQSSLWQREYRPATSALLDRVATKAWSAADTQRALRELVIAMDPIARQSIADNMGAVIAGYMADAFWRVVKSNSTRVFSLMAGSPPDLSSLNAALGAALRDPAVQPALRQLGPKLLAMPQTELLMERFVANAAEAAEHDPATFDVLSRIASDPRLGQEAGSVRANAAEFLRHVGLVLWGIGDNRSLNSLAGLALKTAINGASRPLILLMDADSAMALAQEMPGGVTLLVPGTAQ